MADTLHLQIITPDKKLVEEDTDQVQIPGKSGYLGILPGHAPLLTELMIGEISYNLRGTMQHIAVSWGFAEEARLAKFNIARVHRTRLVNLARINGLRPGPNGDFELTLRHRPGRAGQPPVPQGHRLDRTRHRPIGNGL